MRYFTNRGLLIKENEDTSYQVPTKSKKYDAQDVKVYCEAEHKYYSCVDGETMVEFDLDQLVTQTITYTLDIAMMSEPIDFKYRDRYGNEVSEPESGYDEPIVEETEEDTEEDTWIDFSGESEETEIQKEFMDELNRTDIENLTQAKEWLNRLEEIYGRVTDDTIKIDLDYEIQKRNRELRAYLEGMPMRTKQTLNTITEQYENDMRARNLKNRYEKLVQEKERIENMPLRNIFELDNRQSATDKWLNDWDKWIADYEERDKERTEQIDRVLSGQSRQVYQAYVLQTWKG